MGISRFDKRRSAQFNPLSFEQINYAPSMLQKRYDTMEEGAVQAGDKLAMLAGTGDADAQATLDKWNSELDNLSASMGREGYTPELEQQFNNIRKSYSRDVMPIAEYKDALGAAQKEMSTLSKNPDNIIHSNRVNPYKGYKDWNANRSNMSDYQVYSRDKVRSEGTEVGSQIAKMMDDPTIKVEGIQGYPALMDIVQRGKFTNINEAEQWLAGEGAEWFGSQLAAKGYEPNEEVLNEFKTSVATAMITQDKHKVQNDQLYLQQVREQAALRKAKKEAAAREAANLPPNSNEYIMGKKQGTSVSMPAKTLSGIKSIINNKDYDSTNPVEAADMNKALWWDKTISRAINKPGNEKLKAEYDEAMIQDFTYPQKALDSGAELVKDLGVDMNVDITELVDYAAKWGEDKNIGVKAVAYQDILDAKINEEYKDLFPKLTTEKDLERYEDFRNNIALAAMEKIDWAKNVDKITEETVSRLGINPEVEQLGFVDPKESISLLTDYVRNNTADISQEVVGYNGIKDKSMKPENIDETLTDFISKGVVSAHRTRGGAFTKPSFTVTNKNNEEITFNIGTSGSELLKVLSVENNDPSIVNENSEYYLNDLLMSSDNNKINFEEYIPELIKTQPKMQGVSVGEDNGSYYLYKDGRKIIGKESGKPISYNNLHTLFDEVLGKLGQSTYRDEFNSKQLRKFQSTTDKKDYYKEQRLN